MSLCIFSCLFEEVWHGIDQQSSLHQQLVQSDPLFFGHSRIVALISCSIVLFFPWFVVDDSLFLREIRTLENDVSVHVILKGVGDVNLLGSRVLYGSLAHWADELKCVSCFSFFFRPSFIFALLYERVKLILGLGAACKPDVFGLCIKWWLVVPLGCWMSRWTTRRFHSALALNKLIICALHVKL